MIELRLAFARIIDLDVDDRKNILAGEKEDYFKASPAKKSKNKKRK